MSFALRPGGLTPAHEGLTGALESAPVDEVRERVRGLLATRGQDSEEGEHGTVRRDKAIRSGAAAPGAAGAAARCPPASALAKRLRARVPSRRRSAAAPSRCGAWPRRSVPAQRWAAAAGCATAARSGPAATQASSAPPRRPLTNAATTYRPYSARRRGVSPPPYTSCRTPRQPRARDDQRVRDERYGESASGASFRA
jgi:hypothetical protein